MKETLFLQVNHFKTENTILKATSHSLLIDKLKVTSMKFIRKCINQFKKKISNTTVVKREFFQRLTDKNGQHKNLNHHPSVKQN